MMRRPPRFSLFPYPTLFRSRETLGRTKAAPRRPAAGRAQGGKAAAPAICRPLPRNNGRGAELHDTDWARSLRGVADLSSPCSAPSQPLALASRHLDAMRGSVARSLPRRLREDTADGGLADGCGPFAEPLDAITDGHDVALVISASATHHPYSPQLALLTQCICLSQGLQL